MEATPRLLSLLLAAFVACCGVSRAVTHSLTAEQCKNTLRTIGKALETTQITEAVVKGTWVSPRCEVRRIQDAIANGQKTSFLLRMIDIPNRRRWTGIYFFYRDEDCREPSYALEMQGHLATKGGITFNITTVKVAVYRQEADKALQTNYNKSCPGHMVSEWVKTNTQVYGVDKMAGSQVECLKALGIDQEEFTGAFFQTHLIDRSKVVELFQKTVDLRKQRNKGSPSRKIPRSQQWPLQQHNRPMCLTCIKIGLGKLRHPPKLYARNSSGIDGTWGSSRCRNGDRGVYTTQFDKFAGNTIERFVFVLKDSACKKPSFGLHTMGTLRRVSASIEVPGGVVYEMTIKKAFLTVYSESTARILSINPGNCGKEVWEKGKRQDLGPTKGCHHIGYVMGPPELVLIRTVRDENRNELYFGTDPDARRNKAGPVAYNSISQDCAKFPVVMATPAPTVKETDPAFLFPTTHEALGTEGKESVPVEEVLVNTKPRSGTTLRRGLMGLTLFCFVLIRAQSLV